MYSAQKNIEWYVNALLGTLVCCSEENIATRNLIGIYILQILYMHNNGGTGRIILHACHFTIQIQNYMYYGAWLCISSLPGFVQLIIIFHCVTQELLPLWPAHLKLLYPARTAQVSNVKVGRVYIQQQSCPCQLDPTHPPSGKRVSCVLHDISTLFISWKNGVCCRQGDDWWPWPNN